VCPRCSTPLVVRDVDGVVVAACPKNHGLFATHHALEGLAHAADGPRAEEQPVVACPRCSEPMTARLFTRGSTIVVDVCDAHGTWLDAGELQAATAEPSANAPTANSTSASDALNRRAAAILDVSLALEQAREEETAREAIDVADDLIDTFNVFVLGRTRTSYGRHYRSR
jgi:Zn-finger nucleic acid-binding protein